MFSACAITACVVKTGTMEKTLSLSIVLYGETGGFSFKSNF